MFPNRISAEEPAGNKDYVTNAFVKENEDFQRKADNTTETCDEYRDTVNISSKQEEPLPSENYEDYRKAFITKEANTSFPYNSRGEKLQEALKELVQKYCNGEVNDEDIKKVFAGICQNTSLTIMGCSRIQEAYEYFQKANARWMVNMCFKAGSGIAEKNGGKEKNNWVYYDSDYYKKSEHLRKLLRETANEITSERNIDSLDFEKIEKESKFTLDGGLDFNSVWNYRARARGICSMAEEWEPQGDFSVFYQALKNKTFDAEKLLESQAGVCIVEFKNNIWSMEVPFNNSFALEKPEDHFNLKELFLRNIKNIGSDLLEQLEHFNVYSSYYNHNKVFTGK